MTTYELSSALVTDLNAYILLLFLKLYKAAFIGKLLLFAAKTVTYGTVNCISLNSKKESSHEFRLYNKYREVLAGYAHR